MDRSHQGGPREARVGDTPQVFPAPSTRLRKAFTTGKRSSQGEASERGGVELAGLPHVAFGDLAHPFRGIHAVVDEVELIAGDEEIVVGRNVDGPHAVARELGGRRLCRDDPDLLRPGEEEILDLPVAREDAIAVELASVEPTHGTTVLEHPTREVRFVALRKAQGGGIPLPGEAGDASTAMDEIRGIRPGESTRPAEVLVGLQAIRRSPGAGSAEPHARPWGCA